MSPRRSAASFWLTLSTCFCAALVARSAFAQLAPNQTNGFGNGRLVTFTYLQNFDCVDQPNLDLDFNGKLAQSDPNEMQLPICQPITEPTQDPTGGDIKHTAHLYVLVPMFSVDHDINPDDAMDCPDRGRPGELCGPALGRALIAAFGFVPEAWKKKVDPAITTQCPDPNNPVPGTCTMHSSSVDLSKTLFALGKTGPPTTPIFVPTPNHSHVVDNSRVNAQPIWWEVRPVLVLSQGDWPAADGSSGITSSKVMDDVEAAGRAIEVGSNFFLFFSSRMGSASAHLMHVHASGDALAGANTGHTQRNSESPNTDADRSTAK
ncbi:MAG TPA: hypothetical protein VJA66_11090 [Thermoanaerobaculia bacterium]